MPISSIDKQNSLSSNKNLSVADLSVADTSQVDSSKRQTLKKISGTALLATVPSIALSAVSSNNVSYSKDKAVVLNSGTELSISLTLEPQANIRITNNTDEPIVLKHVYPGILHAGYHNFDINEAFVGGDLTIAARQTHSVKVSPIKGTQAETDFPRHLYSKQPLRVAYVTGSDRRGTIINSSRSFYA